MKLYKNVMLGFLIFTAVLIISVCTYYNYNLKPVKNSDEVVKIVIPKGSSAKNIAKILKDNDLIRNEKIFVLYLKIMNENNLNYGTYEIAYNSGVKNIVEILKQKNTYNEDEISITFKEGITMRDIAKIISEKTDNSYDSVIEKANDKEYIQSLIDKYWFIDSSILNDDLYYKLEGYLFPDTYRFSSKSVSVEEIFNKMIAEMAKNLDPLKADINKSEYSVHQLLTLASMIEKESYDNDEERKNISSVFINRLKRNMSLGSDVTTRYAYKVDDPKQVLTAQQYHSYNPYNTRCDDGSMNGKLPIGPISTISLSSLTAAVNPNNTNYIYFIANIQTKETFFYENYNDFLKKKNELKSVNGGF